MRFTPPYSEFASQSRCLQLDSNILDWTGLDLTRTYSQGAYTFEFINMSKLEIALLNVRGLQDNNKRKRIFQSFRNSKFDIILLQETHSTDEDIVLWKKDWTGRAFFSSLNSIKSGVAILCKESKNFKVEFEGRILSVTVETQKNKFQITNIYASNIPL